MRYFKVTSVVSEDLLPTIVSLLVKEVKQFNVEEVDPKRKDVPAEPSKRELPIRAIKKTHAVPIHKQRAGSVVFNLMEKGQIRLSEAMDAVEASGFTRTTASPTLSRLKAGGYIRQIGEGLYERTGKE